VVLWEAQRAGSGEPAAAHRRPAPLLESDDARVRAFAERHAGSERNPWAAASRLAEAVHPLVDAHKREVPPSAVIMLSHGGDCDGAAALLTAALRALGHAARPVVGYRLHAGRFVPHAWTEVHTKEGWQLVDATLPRAGTVAPGAGRGADGHLKLFEGLGGALTMGRVLGQLRIEPAE
jgi:transglutaminase-like putative cysteine protease